MFPGPQLCSLLISVLLTKVEDVGGEERRFLANVGEGFLFEFLNVSPPIDWHDFGHCSEKGIGHCDVEPLGLLRTKDGKNKLDHPTLPRVLTIHRMEPVLRVMLRSKLSYEESIFTASPPFSLPREKTRKLPPIPRPSTSPDSAV